MKNLFSLVTAGTLALGALRAQAQFTVDGVLSSTEIGTGVGKYQLAGSYTGTHLEADRGLQALYVGYTATTLNIMVVGVAESATTTSPTYRGLIIYLNTAGRTGTAKGTKLIGGNDGNSPLKHKPTLDLETDYGFRAQVGPTSTGTSEVYFSRVSYVTGTTVAPGTDSYIGQGSKAGAQVMTSATAAPDLLNSKFAYKNAGTITANTANNGFEIEIPLAALGTATSPVAMGSSIDLFAAFTDGDGVFTTTDIIPQVVGQATAFGADPDFTLIPGTQAVSFILGTGALASRAGVATDLGFGVYPNPAGKAATATYLVPNGRQDVALSVYNTLGQLVRSVARGPQASLQQVELGRLPAGAYLVRLQVGSQATSRKLLVE